MVAGVERFTFPAKVAHGTELVEWVLPTPAPVERAARELTTMAALDRLVDRCIDRCEVIRPGALERLKRWARP